jgi:hypothetical protein
MGRPGATAAAPGPKAIPSAEEVFKKIDTNNDGKITLDEFKVAYAKMVAMHKQMFERIRQMAAHRPGMRPGMPGFRPGMHRGMARFHGPQSAARFHGQFGHHGKACQFKHGKRGHGKACQFKHGKRGHGKTCQFKHGKRGHGKACQFKHGHGKSGHHGKACQFKHGKKHGKHHGHHKHGMKHGMKYGPRSMQWRGRGEGRPGMPMHPGMGPGGFGHRGPPSTDKKPAPEKK